MHQRLLLRIGVSMPFIYGLTYLVCALTTPGYSPLADPPSELGQATAPYALVFNSGVLLASAAGIVGGLGLILGLGGAGRPWLTRTAGGLAGLALVAGSAGLAMSGLFPLPDRRHYGFGLTIFAALAPLLGALALVPIPKFRSVALALAAGFLLIVALVALRSPAVFAGLAMMACAAIQCAAVERIVVWTATSGELSNARS